MCITMVGLYNSIMINSESSLTSAPSLKRLDEMNGEVIEGRSIAASVVWKKITPVVAATADASLIKETSDSALEPEVIPAAVTDELSLDLVQVRNSMKWKKDLAKNQFSGNLNTVDGIIKSMSVSLPDGQELSFSLSELKGNVFSYNFNGEVLSGLFYQADKNTYMVTLSNGPLEGTALQFAKEGTDSTQTENNVAESVAGAFGTQPTMQAETMVDTVIQDTDENIIQAIGFNFDQDTL